MGSVRYVILDRDGVINEDSDDFIKSPDEWRPIPDSLEAVALLNQAGYEVVVISNQSGIARGYFTEETLNSIHQKMNGLTTEVHGHIARIYYCPHGPDSSCSCRKPKPGLFLRFAEEFDADLSQTYAIGDSWRDLEAARAVNARPILVLTGKGAATLAQHPDLTVPVFDTLYDAAQFLVS